MEHKERMTNALFNDQIEGLYYELTKSGDLAIARTVGSHQQEVKFRVDSCPTYGAKLKRGDRLLLFIDREWILSEGILVASHARFIETQQLESSEVNSYLDNLMAENPNEESSSEVLKKIEQCPAPWRYILNSDHLDQRVVLLVLSISNAVVQADLRRYPEKYQRFLQEFVGKAFVCGPLSALLRNALEGDCHPKARLIEEPQSHATTDKLVKACMSLVESVANYAPKVIPTVIPLIILLVEHKISACEPSFVLSLLMSAVGQDCDPASAHWRKLPLEITPSELQRVGRLTYEGVSMSEMGAINHLAFLPSVRTQGAYDSEDSYMDTYIRLLREDRLSGLCNAVAALKR